MRRNLLDVMRDRVVIADGGIGTELQRAGLEPGECSERWNLERPELVAAMHRAYVAAGAEVLTTNSFRGNRVALADFGLEERTDEINRRAAELACEAAGESAWVVGSIGPFGGFLAPVGETVGEVVYDAFREQAAALLAGGVDALLVETMTAADEMRLALLACRAAGANLVLASMAFDAVKDGYRTMMGVTPEEAVAVMEQGGADVIGCNCGARLSMSDYAAIARQMRACSSRPLLVQANAGQPELKGGAIVYHQSPASMAEGVPLLVRSGARIVGGCCGTTPDHIRAFRAVLAGVNRQ